MKKILNRKGDGLSSIIVAIIFIVIALLIIPAFRGIQSDSSNGTKAISNTNVQFVNAGLGDSGNAPTYGGTTGAWTTTDATGGTN